jgi:transposase-like protein
MNPQPLFCLNLDCPSRGQTNAGNIHLHSGPDQRFRCHTCGRTFVCRKGTLFYRLKVDPQIVVWVLMLLSRGCPLPAIVFAFHLDARTVVNWQKKAGEHAQHVHEQWVVQQPRDLRQVQADEIRAKLQHLVVWMAMAMQVPTRLWLGGALSASRDRKLIWGLVQTIRAQALERPILLVTDGLSSYVTAWRRAFKNWVLTPGKRGGPKRVPWPCVVIGQVIKK